MATGYKTGGRQPGTPNRATLEVQQKLAALGVDPIVGIATIAEDVANPVEIRLRAYSEICHYVYPRRRSVEVDGNVEVGIKRVISAEPLTNEEWLEKYGRKD
jgi:hypothetical protein